MSYNKVRRKNPADCKRKTWFSSEVKKNEGCRPETLSSISSTTLLGAFAGKSWHEILLSKLLIRFSLYWEYSNHIGCGIKYILTLHVRNGNNFFHFVLEMNNYYSWQISPTGGSLKWLPDPRYTQAGRSVLRLSEMT